MATMDHFDHILNWKLKHGVVGARPLSPAQSRLGSALVNISTRRAAIDQYVALDAQGWASTLRKPQAFSLIYGL
jgi:hypothetical protein